MSDGPAIYLNACSLGLPDPTCAEALAHEALRPPGRVSDEARLRQGTRDACGRLLRTDPRNVGLGTGTFQLWSTFMGRLPMRRGRILVAAHEWGDHVRWLERFAAKSEITVDPVPASEGHALDPQAWAARMDDDVIALCLPLVTSVEGLHYPARAIASLPRPDDALVVLDVAQAIGRITVEPDEIGCDILVGTARKWLRGPRQTAMFWLSDRARRVLGAEVKDIELLDLNAALLAGLAQALEVVETRGLARIAQDIARHDTRLRAGLEGAPHLTPRPPGTAGTVTFSVPSKARPDLETRLSEAGIVAKWCNARRDEPLSPSAPNTERLRLSPHVYNQDGEIDLAVKALSPNT